ncbi:hypothetical protein RHSIM_Rhsim07G0182700 [Rhododendron simsii]|uniref:Uncharacterized protein n=1 Tax=Rhododendron simsii TaxID=118357 RepID=A0A834LHZ1_RHOSS|nr:hypothetical protein RHSIM_Rhsim07G0182700 [Rhododendron simsii]
MDNRNHHFLPLLMFKLDTLESIFHGSSVKIHQTKKSLTRKEFTYGLQMRFDPNAFEDATGELTKLKQNSIIQVWMDARSEKGLCYNCDEKFIRGHRCQRKQLYLMMVDEDKIDDIGQDDQAENERALEDEIQLSMHALSGSNSFRTMKILGFLRGKAITILIDSGSTHNFVEPGAVRLSGVTIQLHISL